MTRIRHLKARKARTNMLGVPVGFKPGRDQRLPVRSIPCPTCKVAVDEYCVSTKGTPAPAHISRRRMVIRQLNNEQEVQLP